MDVAVDLAAPLPMMVIAEMLGIPLEDRPRLQSWSDAVLALSDTVSSGGRDAERAVATFRSASVEMRDYVDRVVRARRAVPTDDLLSRLVHADVDGERLADVDILGFFQLLLVAGSETTANLVGNAVLCLTEHPALVPRLRAAPDLLPPFIEEVLRHRSPVHVMFRRATRAVELHGRVVPDGELVLAVIGAANRDPAQFADAERFVATRDPNPHIAFGYGAHFCLGAWLARLEGRIALACLLARIREVELVADAPWQPRKAFHVHGPASLPIRFLPA